ncbi:hypothetical protein ROLI_007770 [Roseobacter fucihabitans]|uniref:Uncharacterized protein n=1 Tax=Roseobacter fucihabitans TaxID=1537242 RepID=A0ABZ2BPB3_9RHOB|nr:hypothetical protein [Roseobacter litoralis]MBC6966055.1 hypothetical protein [Roseobacter litoralis]
MSQLLESIPKEWPRVFSVVSIGFIGIYAGIEVAGDLNNRDSFSITGWAQEVVDPLPTVSAGIILFLSVFAAYAVGELITTIAPVYVTQNQKQRRLQMLIAARDDETGFVREVLRKTDNKVEFFCGLFTITMLSWVAKMVVLTWLGAYWGALYQLPGIALSLVFFHYSREMAVRDIRLLITAQHHPAAAPLNAGPKGTAHE